MDNEIKSFNKAIEETIATLEKIDRKRKQHEIADVLDSFAILYNALKLKDGAGGEYLSIKRDGTVLKTLDDALDKFLKDNFLS